MTSESTLPKAAEAVADQPAHVLWTGGWDSTFRLLELLTQTSQRIQPHYVIDPRRRSATMELEVIRHLTDILISRGYAEPGRIASPIVYRREEIPHDEAIEQAFDEVRRDHRLGNQYQWLAMLVKAKGLDGIELSVEKGSLYPIVSPYLMTDAISEGKAYRIDPSAEAVATLLGHFSFPLIKRDDACLRQQATEREWDGVLSATCFCHTPVLGRYPCGTCRPCVLMLERKGESARLGWIGKARYWCIERVIRFLPKGLAWRYRNYQEKRAVRRSQGAR